MSFASILRQASQLSFILFHLPLYMFIKQQHNKIAAFIHITSPSNFFLDLWLSPWYPIW